MSTARYIARGLGRGAVRMRAAAEGITLVELLVVLTILGLMAAIVIPTFARFGFFSRNQTQQGVQVLYKALAAARVHAATYRVNTAIAYGFSSPNPIDSASGQSVKTIDSYTMVQKVPNGCKLFFNGDDLTGDKTAFIPVSEAYQSGMFVSLPKDTALLADCTFPNRKNNDLYDSVYYIEIYRGDFAPDGKSYIATEKLTQPDWSDCTNKVRFTFVGHVFTPSGRMETSAKTVKERFTVSVGYAPDADPVERFVTPENPQEGYRTIDIELYRGTGRVQIVREES